MVCELQGYRDRCPFSTPCKGSLVCCTCKACASTEGRAARFWGARVRFGGARRLGSTSGGSSLREPRTAQDTPDKNPEPLLKRDRHDAGASPPLVRCPERACVLRLTQDTAPSSPGTPRGHTALMQTEAASLTPKDTGDSLPAVPRSPGSRRPARSLLTSSERPPPGDAGVSAVAAGSSAGRGGLDPAAEFAHSTATAPRRAWTHTGQAG